MHARRAAVRARHRQGDAGGRGGGRRRAAARSTRGRARSTRWVPRWPGSASTARPSHTRVLNVHRLRRPGGRAAAGAAWRHRPRGAFPPAGGARGCRSGAGWRPTCAVTAGRRGIRRGTSSSSWPTSSTRWMPRRSTVCRARSLLRRPAGHASGGAAPDRVGRLVLIDPAVALAGRTRCWRRPRRPRHDEGWATAEEARESRISLREPAAAGAAVRRGDLAVALERDADGRYRLRYCVRL